MGVTNCEKSVESDLFYSLADITKFAYKHIPDKYIYRSAYIYNKYRFKVKRQNKTYTKIKSQSWFTLWGSFCML